MRDDVVSQLKETNRRFYNRFAGAFSDSRAPTEPGLTEILRDVKPGERFLDLGCGQGRVVLLLPQGCEYVGVDYSSEMLALARKRAEAAGISAHFTEVDLLEPLWSQKVSGPFHWILLRAVLHHIPGVENRKEIVRQAMSHLKPGGRLILANWQFLEIPRLRRRIQPWDKINLREEDVEAGDYLLDWKREGYGLRYVHLVDESETQELADASGLLVERIFRADGHHNNLTLYAVLYFPPQ